jgi:UrcA family protein
MKKRILQGGMALLIAIGVGGSAFAVAASPGQYEEVSIKVKYADIDIDHDAGAQVLYGRLQRAATKTCSHDYKAVLRERTHLVAFERCYTDALASAVDKIDSRALAEIHSS